MIIKISPDREKVKSMINLIKDRKEFISSIEILKFPTIVAEEYYEIIKESAMALLLLDGFKTTGENAHKEAINFLSKYKEIEDWELSLIDDLRIKRNKSSYEGKKIDIIYIENKKDKFLSIIKKLEILLNKRLSK